MIRRFFRSGTRYSASAMVVGMMLAMAHPASAQQKAAPVGDNAVEPPSSTSVPVVQPIAPSPTRALNAALSRLARDPRDISALLDAGGAALDLGDTDAAIGFLTRAEQVAPGTAGVRARMGIAMLRANQPFEAIRWFDMAEQAGFNRAEMATDRGLAYDLIGDNAAAQREYQLALSAGKNDEATRRYALSLVIAGDRRGAEQVLQPLLERQDRGAWRVRTFIMAIAGQSEEAEGIARATMPADLAAAISPYLRYMPRLTPSQQAAAANLGRFPRAADIGRDDPQVVQYALAHPRAPRVDAALVPQGEALGARVRDDRAKRRRPGKEDRQQTAVAAAAPVPAPAPGPALVPPPPPTTVPTTPAVSAPWGLQPGTRTAAAPQQTPQPQTPQPQTTASRPTVLSKLDVPPGTPLAPPPTPRPAIATPSLGAAPPASTPRPTTAATPAPAPVQVAASTPAPNPAAPGPQLALAAPQPATAPPAATTPAPASAPAPAPAPAAAPAPADAAPADFRSMFDGFKPPEQEASATTTEAVDLARIEALRESARAAAAAKAKERAARDRGARPDGPTAVSRTSDEVAAEPAVTRGGKEKAAKEEQAKDAKAKDVKDAKARSGKDKLALDTDCLDSSAKGGKAGKGAKGAKVAPARGKSAARTKGKGAAEAQCPPENGKSAKSKAAKAELQHPSRIWVQVLTGSNRPAMGKEWQRLAGSAAALRGRKPSITPWRSNYRLLTGPFASDAEAQAFVEKLRSQGVSSYQWTSPAGQAVEGLGTK